MGRIPQKTVSPALRASLKAGAALLATVGAAAPAAAYQSQILSQLQARPCGATLPGSNVTARPDALKAMFAASSGPAVKLDIVEEELGDGMQAVRNCGATYIGGSWLLTAAHCVDDGGYIRIEVVAGTDDINDSNAVRRIATDAVCHAGYDRGTMRNDLALIRLDAPLPGHLRPARLSYARQSRPAGYAEVTGWRRLNAGAVAPRSRTAGLSLNGRQQTDMILAHPQYGARQSVCIGESGSGLFQSGEQIGVFSAVEASVAVGHTGPTEVHSCDAPDTRLIFTPVADHLAWIEGVRAACDSDPDSCRVIPRGTQAPLYAQAAPPVTYEIAPVQTYAAYVEPPNPVVYAAPTPRIESARYVDLGSALTTAPQPTPIAPQPAPYAYGSMPEPAPLYASEAFYAPSDPLVATYTYSEPSAEPTIAYEIIDPYSPPYAAPAPAYDPGWSPTRIEYGAPGYIYGDATNHLDRHPAALR